MMNTVILTKQRALELLSQLEEILSTQIQKTMNLIIKHLISPSPVQELDNVFVTKAENIIEEIDETNTTTHNKKYDLRRIQSYNKYVRRATDNQTSLSNKKQKKNIPKNSIQILKSWLMGNLSDPYPTKNTKKELADKADLNLKQVKFLIVK